MGTKLAVLALSALLAVSAPVATASAAPTSAARSAISATAPSATDRAERAGRAAVERKVVRLTNKKRKAHDCEPLKLRKSIRKAARKHSERMADAGELDHQLPGEPDVGERLEDAGYDNWTSWGENIARGYPTPKAVVKAWMDSPDHRANILDCDFEHIGVGMVSGDGTKWWTQDFGSN
ncbi:MAG TPA: CAP domain-containing protein [Nocardioides sp.]|nr:CAP domain-containing protein [Nocardioides sp.]